MEALKDPAEELLCADTQLQEDLPADVFTPEETGQETPPPVKKARKPIRPELIMGIIAAACALLLLTLPSALCCNPGFAPCRTVYCLRQGICYFS